MEILRPTPEKIRTFIKVKSKGGEENTHYAFIYKGLPKELRLRYERELNETAENREKGLRKLKEIIKFENLDSLNDSNLLAILRSSKFNLNKSAYKLRNFIVHRRELLKKVAAMEITMVKTILEDTAAGILPYRDKHGRAILYSRPYGMHFDKYSVEDAVVLGLVLGLFALSFELSTVAGLVYLGDCNSPSLSIFIPIMNAARTNISSILSLPMRVGKAEIINEFALIRWMVKLFRPLLPEKIYKRVNFNGPYKNLQKSYPTEILPNEFGGSLGPASNEFLKQQLFDFIEKLREEGRSIAD